MLYWRARPPVSGNDGGGVREGKQAGRGERVHYECLANYVLRKVKERRINVFDHRNAGEKEKRVP